MAATAVNGGPHRLFSMALAPPSPDRSLEWLLFTTLDMEPSAQHLRRDLAPSRGALGSINKVGAPGGSARCVGEWGAHCAPSGFAAGASCNCGGLRRRPAAQRHASPVADAALGPCARPFPPPLSLSLSEKTWDGHASAGAPQPVPISRLLGAAAELVLAFPSRAYEVIVSVARKVWRVEGLGTWGGKGNWVRGGTRCGGFERGAEARGPRGRRGGQLTRRNR
jgi:hypothetical protein